MKREICKTVKERDNVIDSLKGLSILGIVLVHSQTNGELPTLANQIKAMGATGTTVFFVDISVPNAFFL